MTNMLKLQQEMRDFKKTKQFSPMK